MPLHDWLTRVPQRRQLDNLACVRNPERMPEIPFRLEPQPKVRAHLGDLCQAQHRVRRIGSFGPGNLIPPGEGHAAALKASATMSVGAGLALSTRVGSLAPV